MKQYRRQTGDIDKVIDRTNVMLHRKAIKDRDVAYISSLKIDHIKDLKLDYNNIGPQGIIYLTSITWVNLQFINIFDNQIGDIGCKYLTKDNAFPILKWLDMGSNRITSFGMTHLTKANWKRLKTFERSKITNIILSKITGMRSNILRQLLLSENKLDCAGFRYLLLMECPIDHMMLWQNSMPKENKEIMRKQFQERFINVDAQL